MQACGKYFKLLTSTNLSCSLNCVYVYVVGRRMRLIIAMCFSAHRSKCFIYLLVYYVYLVEVYCKPLDSQRPLIADGLLLLDMDEQC